MEPKIHLICNAHLDPVWQWQWEEGCAEALSTFRTALHLMNEFDHWKFTHNESILYEWVKKYDPLVFNEIKKRVAEGRWIIAGGWFMQPDANIPQTESFFRHIKFGRKFFKDEFGIEPKVAYNFDSFGHSGGLPQILKANGYEMYVHMRPQKHEMDIPSDLYIWKGIDGSEILAHRIAIGFYHTEYDNLEQRINDGIELALKLNRDVPVFWGIGDHGGGATRSDLKLIEELISNEKRIPIIHSSTEEYYEAVKELSSSLPVVESDLQRVFTGCYTSLSRVKRATAQNLSLLTQTEALASASWWKYGAPYLSEKLNELWKSHLFNDFHDILPGSCIEPAEKDALSFAGSVEKGCREILIQSAAAFNTGKDKQHYLPVTILNSNPAFDTLPVEVECMISYRPKWEGIWRLRLFSNEGTEHPVQEEQPEALLPFNGWRRKVSFMAKVAELGSSHYYLEAVEEQEEQKTTTPALPHAFNQSTGFINTLSVKDTNLLTGDLLKPLPIEDKGDCWGTNCWSYRNQTGEFSLLKDSYRILHSGAIRTISEAIYTYSHSKIVFRTISYPDFPAIEYKLRIHWNEEQQRLKLSIPTILNSDNVLCEVPGGVINRPADGEEHVHGRWIMLSDNSDDNDNAIGICNDGQHGFDFKDGELRLSVLRSAAYCHEQGFKIDELPYRKFADLGVHDVRLVITVGTVAEVRNRMEGLSQWLLMPPKVYSHLPYGTYGDMQPRDNLKSDKAIVKSLLSLKPESMKMLSLQKCENEDALELRLQETLGKQTQTICKFDDITIESDFKPYQIKTFKLHRNGTYREM